MEQTSRYDQLSADALAAYEAGDYTRARELFRAAHRTLPSARALRAIAMCSYNLHDAVAAVLELEAALAEPRGALPESLRAASQELLQRAEHKVARFDLALRPSSALLTVDGAPAQLTQSGTLLLPPGTRRVRAVATGHLAFEGSVEAVAGQRSTLHITLVGEPALVTAPGGSPRREGVAEKPDAPPSVARWTVFGLGVGGLVMSAVTGAIALHERAALRDRCYDGVCSPAVSDQVVRYDRLKVATTVGLVTGGTLLTVDLAWWLYGRRHSARVMTAPPTEAEP